MCVAQKDSSRSIPERTRTDAEGWQLCARLNKSEADQLLDWLEANGYLQREVIPTEEGKFTVRWRR